jgi:hypothetical protein
VIRLGIGDVTEPLAPAIVAAMQPDRPDKPVDVVYLCTPGSGFGPGGEGYFRLSVFNSRANIDAALNRIRRVFGAGCAMRWSFERDMMVRRFGTGPELVWIYGLGEWTASFDPVAAHPVGLA